MPPWKIILLKLNLEIVVIKNCKAVKLMVGAWLTTPSMPPGLVPVIKTLNHVTILIFSSYFSFNLYSNYGPYTTSSVLYLLMIKNLIYCIKNALYSCGYTIANYVVSYILCMHASISIKIAILSLCWNPYFQWNQCKCTLIHWGNYN